MSYVLHFEVDALPHMPNRLLGAHWRIRSNHAKVWRAWVGYKTIGKRPPAPLAQAKLTLVRHSSSEPDSDGLRGSFKSVIDALVFVGVLEDDRPANIGEPKVSWEKAPPKKGKIMVVVESVE